MQVRQAQRILDEFFGDRDAYPDDDVLMRTGICKVLAEEFHPLVRLAQSLRGVRNLRLHSPSNPGPDAIITFWWRRAARLQITCSNEGYSRALEREYLRDKGSGLMHQNWERDPSTRHVVAKGPGYFEPPADLELRLDRILAAIDEKENKYHSATEILLVQEDPAGYQYLQDGRLHDRLRAKVLSAGSHYRHIYVNYGDRLRRIK